MDGRMDGRKNQSLPSLLLCSLTSDITGDVSHHHLTLSVKELTYSSMPGPSVFPSGEPGVSGDFCKFPSLDISE